MFLCRWLVFGMASLLFLGACSLNRYEVLKPADYQRSVKNFDVTIGWNFIQKDGQVSVDGYARNNRYYIMEELELWIALLDATGVEKAKNSFYIIPSSLRLDESAGFKVMLVHESRPGDKLRFLYSYKAVENNEGRERWMNSFEAPVIEKE